MNKSAFIIQKYYKKTDICAICYNLVRKNNLNNCKHHYHELCLEKYSKDKCPQCFIQLIKTNLQKKKLNLLNINIDVNIIHSLFNIEVKQTKLINSIIKKSREYMMTYHYIDINENYENMRDLLKILKY